MSGRSSVTSVPNANVGDALAANHTMQPVGAKYQAVPVTVADGEAQGFAIDSSGRQIMIGGEADNALMTLKPIGIAGIYNLAAPTYGDGDVATLQTTVNGYLRVSDAVLAALDKGAGVVTANTLRVQPTTEALTNVYLNQGAVADNAAASGNPVRIGGVYSIADPVISGSSIGSLQISVKGHLKTQVIGADADNAAYTVNPLGVAAQYNLALPTYNDGDVARLQADASGYLRVTINPASEVLIKGVDADNAPATVNPIGIGGVYNAALPTLDDGDRGDMQLDVNGRARIAIESEPRTGLAVLDTKYNDYASANLPGNATNPLELVASTSGAIKKISVWDTGGAPCELMTGAAASEVRKMVLGPGADGEFEVDIPSGTRVSIRRLDSATALAVGDININFLG